MKKLIAIVVVVVFILAGNVWADILFNEDFEGGSDPQLIINPPFSWGWDSSAASSPQTVRSGTGLPTCALDGSSGDWGQHISYVSVPGPSVSATKYELSADLYVRGSDSHNSGIALYEDPSWSGNSVGIYYVPLSEGGWTLFLPGKHLPLNCTVNNQKVHVTIAVDMINNLVICTLTDSGNNAYTISEGVQVGFAESFGCIRIYNDQRYFRPGGLDVDNIVLSETVHFSVDIDIKPGSYPNAINLGSNGLIPVAIFSSDEFDATTIDPKTVELAGAAVAVRGKKNKYMAHNEDVDGDGLLDLLVQVVTDNLDPDSLQDGYAVLTGNTFDGEDIMGKDEIKLVPPDK